MKETHLGIPMGRSSIVFSALLPHPPIVVPAVGRGREAECRRTLEACREVGRRLVAAAPARLVLVSPHSPRQERAFGVWDGPRLRGDLGDFAAPRATVELPTDPELQDALAYAAAARGVALESIPSGPLDHGAVVPLWFLAEAGWQGPTTVLALPWPGGAPLDAMGHALAEALGNLGRPAALVASGDMSHRVLPGAPAGFHPRAKDFDEALVELVRAGRLAEAQAIDPVLRELAAEDAVDSLTVVAAAHGFAARGCEVFSYEHPFGVGYMVAVLHAAAPPQGGLAALPRVAQEAIRAALEERPPRDLPPPEGELARRAPVFVTLRRHRDGALRGCIGSLVALHDNLVAETADRARAAAFEDPRFPPVTREELDDLHVEVSILGPAEAVADLEELDPRRWGVVVRDDHGRRGVLLPDIPGVDSPGQQVEIARRKAGIPPGATLHLERFPVEKIQEPDPPPPEAT